eukprot:scaffold5234_cov131-Cylindrotheca_fusiformis.AAC.15
MPNLLFFKSKSKKSWLQKGSKTNSSRSSKKQSSSGGIFRRTIESSDDDRDLQQGLTWSWSEDSWPEEEEEEVFGGNQAMQHAFSSTYKTDDDVLCITDHQNEIAMLKTQQAEERFKKDQEIISLRLHQAAMERKHSEEIASFEELLLGKERELQDVKDELVCTKEELRTMGTTLIQTQQKLHDLSGMWPYRFFSHT